MSKVITVFNQKGGVGKTTIAVHTAGVLARAGHRVMLVDADHQGTAVNWISNAEEGHELPLRIASLSQAGRKLHTHIQPFIEDNDYIVIDCPPSKESNCTQSALLIADVAVMPINPSPADLWASTGAEELLEAARVVNEDLIALAVWNEFDRRRILARGAREFVENMSLRTLSATLGYRESFRQAIALGGLVHDVPDAAAVREINHMVKEILESMNEVQS